MPIYCDSNIKALNNIRAGDTHGEGYASAFQHTSIADDSVIKIAAGGSNGVMLLKVVDFNGTNRVSCIALFSYMTEAPSTICDVGHFSGHGGDAYNGGTARASHEILYYVGANYADEPGHANNPVSGFTDSKITIWTNYPKGLYFINRSGFALYGLDVWNFREVI